MKKQFIFGIVILTVAVSAVALSAVAMNTNSSENTAAESSTHTVMQTARNTPENHSDTSQESRNITAPTNTEFSDSSEQKTSEKEKIFINKDDCIIEGLEDIVFDGNKHTLGISVTYDGKVLDADNDYDVKYDKELVNPDKYTAEIIFKGDYEGTVKKEFHIIPQNTVISDIATKTNSIHIEFEPLENIPENISGYQIEYSKNEDFSDSEIYNAESANVSSVDIDVEQDNAVYYLRIRTYLKRDSDNEDDVLYSLWSEPESAELLQIEEKDGLTYVDGIIIANKTYRLPSDYAPDVNKEAVTAFEKMAADATEDDIYLTIVSGYRSYDLQDWLYHSYVEERGQENADRISARPGHSEHQTGLAFDINTTASSFAGTPEAIWLDENCYKYGFIVRYPEGKEAVTGYAYEPWHIRYIGYPYSEKVYQSGLTLEEYFGITSKYQEEQIEQENQENQE